MRTKSPGLRPCGVTVSRVVGGNILLYNILLLYYRNNKIHIDVHNGFDRSGFDVNIIYRLGGRKNNLTSPALLPLDAFFIF